MLRYKKIIKFTIYLTVCFTSGGGVEEVVVNPTNYQGWQFDLVQCQESKSISDIKNGFLQYVQNYFQYKYPLNQHLMIKK